MIIKNLGLHPKQIARKIKTTSTIQLALDYLLATILIFIKIQERV